MNTEASRHATFSPSTAAPCQSPALAAGLVHQTGCSSILAPAAPDEVEQIAFILLPAFSLAAFSAAVEPLRVANMISGTSLFDWSVFSIDGDAVQCSNGTLLQPTGSIRNVSGQRNILVCGGLPTSRLSDITLLSLLRRAARSGASIGSLCTGAFVVARAGLLDGYRCAVHHSTVAAFREMFPLAQVCHDLYVVDRTRFSCVGGAAACDMMLQHIALRHGRHLAHKTAQTLLHQMLREPSALDSISPALEAPVRDPKLRIALSEIENNIENPLTLAEIAESAGTSLRQLQRKFQHKVGTPPSAYYLRARLTRAKQLLTQTDMPVTEIALACGFVSTSHFSASFKRFAGCSPREFQRALLGK